MRHLPRGQWTQEPAALEMAAQELSVHDPRPLAPPPDEPAHHEPQPPEAGTAHPQPRGLRAWEEPADPRSRAELVAADPEFARLRRRVRGFAFPMAALFLLWYFAFVLAASYAPNLMATPVLGRINVGLLIGLAQFVTTFALTTAYVRYAERRIDPLAATLRVQAEESPPPPAADADADAAQIWGTR